MKLLDAVWEKRNLGVTTLEICLEKDDNPDEFIEALEKSYYDYYVVKLTTEAIGFSTLLTKKGFVFVEAINHIYHDLDLRPLTGAKKEIVENTDFQKVEHNEMQFIFDNILKGMFNTDRISLDPEFGKDKAAVRYVNWIEDEISNGAEIYKFIYKNNNIGFIGFKQVNENDYHNFIAGIYSYYLGKGLSINMTYKLVDEVIKRNGKKLTTDISSNNIASLKSRINNGFNYEYTTYVYVKHNNPSSIPVK